MERHVTFASILSLTLVLGAAVTGAPDVRKPPTILRPPVPKSLFHRTGDNITLNCEASGIPDPFYTWMLNEIEIKDGHDFTVDGQTGELTINSLTKKKEGFFKCKAKVTFRSGSSATAVSPEVEVRVGRIEDWPRVDNLIPLKKNEGQYAVLKCDDNLPVTYSITTFVWHKIVGKIQNELDMDERMFIDNKGSLHFTYLLDSDNLGVDGYYACGLNNEVARNSQVGGKRKLEIAKLNIIHEVQPKIQFRTGMGEDGAKDLTFKVGQTARLECVFSGYITGGGQSVTDHLPIIDWLEGQQQIISGQGRYKIEEGGHVLTIDNLIEADEKAYTCKARKNGDHGVLNLNVTSPPIFVEPFMKYQTVTQGNDAVLHCLTRPASGEFPPREPKWYKNGRPLSNSDHNKFKFEDGKTKLTVISLNKNDDISCFQCFVDNSVGTSKAEACLNVILPIQVLKEPKKMQTIEEGDIVDLTVQATSDPLYNLAYKWVFKNKTYGAGSLPPHVVYNFTTKETYINTTGMTQEQLHDISGLYSRIIYHSVERVNVSVNVQIKKQIAPVTADVKPQFPYWIIAVIFVGVILLVVIFIVVHVICRRKRQEGAYPLVKKEIAAGLDPEKEFKDSGFQDLS